MKNFRVNEGNITLPITELNRLEDLALELKEKELQLKKDRAKFDANREAFNLRVQEEEDNLNDREETLHNLMMENAEIMIVKTITNYECGCQEVDTLSMIVDDKIREDTVTNIFNDVKSDVKVMGLLELLKWRKSKD